MCREGHHEQVNEVRSMMGPVPQLQDTEGSGCTLDQTHISNVFIFYKLESLCTM